MIRTVPSLLRLLCVLLLSVSGTPLGIAAEAALSSAALGERKNDEPDWAKVIRGFRRDHNFTASLALAQNKWRGRAGETMDRFSARTQAFELQLAYSFHLPLIWGLGYVLGTNGGMIFAEKDTRGFSLARTYILPGIEVGLVWNFNEKIRALTTIAYGWQRTENMTLDMNPREGPIKLGATGDSKSIKLAFDYFFEISTAIRLEGEEQEFSYTAKDKFELDKSSRLLRLGVVKHLL